MSIAKPASISATAALSAAARSASGAATQASLRERNLALVLTQVASSESPTSRADVAALTGLTRSTVSRLVDELVAAALVDEGDPVTGGQRGRPAVPLRPASGTLVGLGLEVNVWHVAASVVDLRGQSVSNRIVEGDFVDSDPARVLAQLAQVGIACLEEARAALPQLSLAGVQLALPGLVDGATLLRAPNLGWHDLEPLPPIRQALAAAGWDPGGYLWTANEADCAALTVLQGSRHDDLLYVSGEVGIGSAAIVGGQVMTGRHGWAGELGHVCVNDGGPLCGCGSHGCLEVYAGRRAILEKAGVDSLDALVAALRSGDARALGAVESAGHALAIAVSAALNLLDLPRVVLGGHLAVVFDWLRPTLTSELNSRVLSAPFSPPEVSAVSLDPAPAAVGAALAVRQRVLAAPASWMPARG
ncbi:MAG: ROK family transcriptional regulator [Propionibacterium sp.]|nr:ROK family transcriptional regulator [Propionibacterium sp.]